MFQAETQEAHLNATARHNWKVVRWWNLRLGGAKKRWAWGRFRKSLKVSLSCSKSYVQACIKKKKTNAVPGQADVAGCYQQYQDRA